MDLNKVPQFSIRSIVCDRLLSHLIDEIVSIVTALSHFLLRKSLPSLPSGRLSWLVDGGVIEAAQATERLPGHRGIRVLNLIDGDSIDFPCWGNMWCSWWW